MTEELEDSASEHVYETGPSAGRLLAEAREQMGLQVADVARQLRLSPRQIEALEADDHERLPGKTFLRGFIRNYAKLLEIDPEPLLKGFQSEQALTRSIVVPTSQIEFGGKRRLMPFSDRPDIPWLKPAAAISVVMLALSWGVYSLFMGSSTSRDIPMGAAGETTMALSLPQQQTEVAPAMSATGALPPAAVVAPNATASVPSSERTADSGGQPLLFVFEGDSWVEVKDANGKVVFYQLNPKGTRQSIGVNPPFSLVVGNAAHVKLSYNGKPIDLAPHIKVDVARLTIE